MYWIILLVAVLATSILSFREGAKHGKKVSDGENMGKYLQGYNQGKADGFKEGENKGRHEGFSDGQRYAMTIEHNRKILVDNGILHEEAK